MSAAVLQPALAQSVRPGMGAVPYADGLGTGVSFRVWAPNAITVFVPGNFNGWNTAATPLVSEGASGLWSADVPQAGVGSQYKYHINGSIWKRDPRSRQVTGTGGLDNSIVIDPAAFDWMGDTPLTVDESDLIIYEMHVGAFYDPMPSSGPPGTFTDAIARLDYLADLGITAVELMPIWEFGTTTSWGYNPEETYAPESSYGGAAAMKAFVRAAHSRGIAVLLDVVHNHYNPTTLGLWGFDNGTTPGIYFYSAAPYCCTPWGQRPNYGAPEVREYIRDNTIYWLEEFHLDGFRWDAVSHIRWTGGPGSTSIPDGSSLLQELNTLISTGYPGAVSIAENNPSTLGFDASWGFSFGGTVVSEVTKTNDAARSMTTLAGTVLGSDFDDVLFTDTHDTAGDLNGGQRLPIQIDATTPDSYNARKLSTLGAALVLTAPGIPMLLMGQEMLEAQQFGASKSLVWSKTNTYSEVVSFYRDLIRLRRNLDGVSPGLTGDGVTITAADNTVKLLGYRRWKTGEPDETVVIMNFSADPITNYMLFGFPAAGDWYANFDSDWTRYGTDYGNEGSGYITVTGTTAEISVGPYSVMVLSQQALPWLDADGDGMPNGWEQEHFGDPIGGDPSGDDDGDLATNFEEYVADTDPMLAASVLKISDVRIQDSDVVIEWQGGVQAEQRLRRAMEPDGTYVDVFTNLPPTATNESVSIGVGVSTAEVFRIEANR